MKKRSKIFLWIATALTLLLFVSVFTRLGDELPGESADRDKSRVDSVMIFGATGTVGSGILDALLNDSRVNQVHVITRRSTDLIASGVESGKAAVTMHMDYLDYDALHEILERVDEVYWALGTSALNVSDEQYSVIHVDFPVALVKTWLEVRGDGANITFHFISGSGASSDGWQHWAREKARAEEELFSLADGTGLKTISYRPGAVVGPEEGSFKTFFIDGVLSPLKMGIHSRSIGAAMIEITMRGNLPNRRVLENREILKYANAYYTYDQ